VDVGQGAIAALTAGRLVEPAGNVRRDAHQLENQPQIWREKVLRSDRPSRPGRQ
jgi:hypothetical protein